MQERSSPIACCRTKTAWGWLAAASFALNGFDAVLPAMFRTVS